MTIEYQFPVIELSTIFYISTYFFALLIPFIIKSKKVMRAFEIDIYLATAISTLLYFLLPFIVKQQSFTPHGFWGRLLLFDRSSDGVSAAFPAFHVIWAFISAQYFSIRYKKTKYLWYFLALLVSISCISTGNHSIFDVIAGIIVFLIVKFRFQIWNLIRFQTERLANSWKEWRFGPIRIINHGFYTGIGGFVGILMIGSFLGSQYAVAGFIIGISGVIGAALWAQFIEGSPKLQRPYGYYGGVIGIFTAGALMMLVFQLNFFILIAASAMAAPWVQVLGRLRCLVQGCCHGKPTNEKLGIHFTHPLSRVNKISGMHGRSLHPTQLYSIATNIITGLVLIRLYNLEMSSAFIIGIYLILNGIGRFVEEYFRGEAQTPYWAGMRIYQWIAIINIVLGAVFTCFHSISMPVFQLNSASFYWAIGMGICATVAYGVDFPESNRRFARLTSI
ncbi:MAG: prolipoprotein diacylglyceryl transferase family protein [Bacteroidales bacterium]